MNRPDRSSARYPTSPQDEGSYADLNDSAPRGTPRDDYLYSPPPMFAPRQETFLASLPSGLVFLTGVWLITAPFVLDYTYTGATRPGFWNDIVIGTVVAVLALVRTVAPREVPWASLVNMALGGWLIIGPFVLDYNDGIDANQAVANDVISGAVLLVLAAASAVITYRNGGGRRDSKDDRRP